MDAIHHHYPNEFLTFADLEKTAVTRSFFWNIHMTMQTSTDFEPPSQSIYVCFLRRTIFSQLITSMMIVIMQNLLDITYLCAINCGSSVHPFHWSNNPIRADHVYKIQFNSWKKKPNSHTQREKCTTSRCRLLLPTGYAKSSDSSIWR